MSSCRVTNCRQSVGAAEQPQRSGELAGAASSRVASSTSVHASLSQSSDDWCTVWKRSSSRCTHSSARLLQREQLVGAQVALVVRRALAGQDRFGEVLVSLGRHWAFAEHTSLQ